MKLKPANSPSFQAQLYITPGHSFGFFTPKQADVLNSIAGNIKTDEVTIASRKGVKGSYNSSLISGVSAALNDGTNVFVDKCSLRGDKIIKGTKGENHNLYDARCDREEVFRLAKRALLDLKKIVNTPK